jgi:hypothetical protein
VQPARQGENGGAMKREVVCCAACRAVCCAVLCYAV